MGRSWKGFSEVIVVCRLQLDQFQEWGPLWAAEVSQCVAYFCLSPTGSQAGQLRQVPASLWRAVHPLQWRLLHHPPRHISVMVSVIMWVTEALYHGHEYHPHPSSVSWSFPSTIAKINHHQRRSTSEMRSQATRDSYWQPLWRAGVILLGSKELYN